MSTVYQNDIADLSVKTVRTLAIDSVEHVQHGHLGMPLGAAPMGYKLYRDIMNYNPTNPEWINRDRFVLTSGHGSILQYVLLHLMGYDVSINDLKSFRQLGSSTPGHPEVGFTPGVEATTGPLGQGISTVVGMAIAEEHLAALYNKEDYNIVDHYTYTICGDGDLMEGVAQEAMSLAGNLGLGKLIVLYDSNDISSDGPLSYSNSENVQEKYKAMGWQTLLVEDGNNLEEIEKAIIQAKEETGKPTLIEVKTIIGYGSPNFQGTAAIHSDPIGDEESTLIKEAYEWEHEEFHVPDEVREDLKEVVSKGQQLEDKWSNLFNEYKNEYPELAKNLMDSFEGKVNVENIDIEFNEESIATRAASGKILNELANKVPAIMGGSADLASSNKTTIETSKFITKNDFSGSNIHFGVREFGMASIVNGIALHGGIKGYSGTFLVFSDYMRSAIRMSALSHLPVTYIFTHDSLLLGPDGPTHQPIEHLASLRAMPNLNVIRPADANEAKAAWLSAINSSNTPTAIMLGRHDVPVIKEVSLEGTLKGAYVLSEAKGNEDGIIIATGSDVELALNAQKILEEENVFVRVVSMPSWELYDSQSEEYKESVLPKKIDNKLVVEMGSKQGWKEYIGDKGDSVTLDEFGASGNGNEIAEKLGFTPENIAKRFKELLKQNKQ
ncbi:transketolase [Carnobacteriaceae bacterium 52-44]